MDTKPVYAMPHAFATNLAPIVDRDSLNYSAQSPMSASKNNLGIASGSYD